MCSIISCVGGRGGDWMPSPVSPLIVNHEKGKRGANPCIFVVARSQPREEVARALLSLTRGEGYTLLHVEPLVPS